MLASFAWLAATTLPLTAPAMPDAVRLGEQPSFTVHLDRPGIEVSPHLNGIFFEEINWAGDGGLYAEMVRNRGFTEGAAHWTALEGVLKVDNRRAIVTAESPAKLVNPGYAGMGLRAGLDYKLKVRLRGPRAGAITAYLSNGKEAVSNRASLKFSTNWTEASVSLQATKTTKAGNLVLVVPAKSKVEFEWVSMFPGDAVSGIFRRDLFNTLKQLKPAFVRFPGGCWVEGDTMETAYRWKKTVVPPIDRAAVYNLWKYQSTNGLGYHEYLQLCRDLNAVPLFVANCGMSHREVIPMDKMGEYVQDVLDSIEYANGPITSQWGALRAKNGSPKPFNLKYLEIGNENGGPAYEERYKLIYSAIKARNPEITTIANVWGGYPQKSPIEVLDEHYYNDPNWFLGQFNRYDSYDRKGPKIYVGEYAVTTGVDNGNLLGALAEGVFMLGMERNADIVSMASYAPLLAHPAGKAWNPDLIYFDGLDVVETPSFHVQSLFAQNRPQRMLESTLSHTPTTNERFPDGGVGVGTWNTSADFSEFRVTQAGSTLYSSKDKPLHLESGNWSNLEDTWRERGGTTGARAFTGDSMWNHYRVELKAKKLSGDEGFLITVGRKDAKNFIWLNLGGWGNTRHAIEWSVDGSKSLIGANRPGRIETGRQYHIAIDYAPDRIKCFIDGELIFDEVVPNRPVVFANAGTLDGTQIVKLINVDSKSHDLALNILGGAEAFTMEGTLLQADDPRATSTFENPKALVPRPIPKRTVRKDSSVKLPRNSLTILRLKAISGEALR